MQAASLIRPMRVEDLPAVARLLGDGSGASGVPLPGPSADPVELEARLSHLLRHDPAGAWVADVDGTVTGAVASLTRELMWLLGFLVVRPEARRQGVGRQLLEVAATHGRGCLRGMIALSSHPAAARLVRQAGFSLHPWIQATGLVRRAALPVVERVREGDAADVDLLDSVDRQVRGAGHGCDHRLLVASHRLVVCDRGTGSGYVYVAAEGGPALLAATNRRTATDLLWESLAATDPATPLALGRISAASSWALDVALEARLDLGVAGYLGVREMRPPQAYLPDRYFL